MTPTHFVCHLSPLYLLLHLLLLALPWGTQCRVKRSHISPTSLVVSRLSSYIYDFYETVTQLHNPLPGRPKRLQNMTSPVVISATAKHTATIIFFHGLGDTGHGWANTMAAVRASHVKVICPTAPTMPVTLNVGFRMPSWFDLRSLDSTGPEDEEGIRRAAAMVHSLIAEEVAAGIPTKRIVIGGFSQGGALAIFSALTFPEPLAGIIAMSSWLPLHTKFPAEAIGNKDTPLLQCHGNCDPIVPYRWGQMTASLLKQFMTQTEFKTYNGMMHTSCDEEMHDVEKFIEKVLKP